MANDLLITDFRCAEPATAWTAADSTVFCPPAAVPPTTWRLLEYTSASYSGYLLQASDPRAPVLRVPLQRTGWHALSLGLSERSWGTAVIEVRLSGMAHWQTLFAVDGHLHEEPWLFADLTGQWLEVRYPQDLGAVPLKPQQAVCARLVSVRAVPMAPEHVARLQQRQHRPLVYTNDGHGIFALGDRPGAHLVGTALGRFAESDWSHCAFAVGGADLVNYPSQVGTRMGEGGWDFPRPCDAHLQHVLEGTLALGIDPLRQAIAQAQAQRQRAWVYLRPQAWTADPELDHAFRSRFYSAHPELRCVEADGTPDNQLSIAFPAVRAQLAGIVAEALARGADGLCLALVRGYPMVRYEAPVCELFQARHGRDARQFPEAEPRLQALWAELVTDWLRELRAQLDAAGPAPGGGRRELAVITGADLAWNARFGFAVPAWAEEKLVDAVLPYPKPTESTGEINVAQYARAQRGTGVPLLPSLGCYGDHRMTLAQIRRRAHAWYWAGADGLSRWDAHGYLARLELNDPVVQELWCEHYLGPQSIELLTVAGITLTTFGPRLGL